MSMRKFRNGDGQARRRKVGEPTLLKGQPGPAAIRRAAAEKAKELAESSPLPPTPPPARLPPNDVYKRSLVILHALKDDLGSGLAKKILDTLGGQSELDRPAVLQAAFTDIHHVYTALTMGTRDGRALVDVLAGILRERDARREWEASQAAGQQVAGQTSQTVPTAPAGQTEGGENGEGLQPDGAQ